MTVTEISDPEKQDANHVEGLDESTLANIPPHEDESNDFKFTVGKFLALASFQLGYMSDVFVLSMASNLLLTINADIGMCKKRRRKK